MTTRRKPDTETTKRRGTSPMKVDEPSLVSSPSAVKPQRTRLVEDGSVVVELVGRSRSSFNTFDAITRRIIEIVLVQGENKIPADVFSAFEEDQFFRDHVLGTLVLVKTRPSPDVEDEGEEVVDL